MGILQRLGAGGLYFSLVIGKFLPGPKNVREGKIVAIVLFKAFKTLNYNPPNKNICFGVRLEYGASYSNGNRPLRI
jgi:hypothetical protein